MVEVEQAAIGVILLALIGIGGYLTYRGLGTFQQGWTIWRTLALGGFLSLVLLEQLDVAEFGVTLVLLIS